MIENIVIKMDNIIDNLGHDIVCNNISYIYNKENLKDIFVNCDIYQRKIIIKELLTLSKYPKIMENVIVSYLFFANIETKDQILECFIGQEELLSPQLKDKIIMNIYNYHKEKIVETDEQIVEFIEDKEKLLSSQLKDKIFIDMYNYHKEKISEEMKPEIKTIKLALFNTLSFIALILFLKRYVLFIFLAIYVLLTLSLIIGIIYENLKPLIYIKHIIKKNI